MKYINALVCIVNTAKNSRNNCYCKKRSDNSYWHSKQMKQVLYEIFVLFMSCVCHAFASVNCCLVVTALERAELLALVCDV